MRESDTLNLPASDESNNEGVLFPSLKFIFGANFWPFVACDYEVQFPSVSVFSIISYNFVTLSLFLLRLFAIRLEIYSSAAPLHILLVHCVERVKIITHTTRVKIIRIWLSFLAFCRKISYSTTEIIFHLLVLCFPENFRLFYAHFTVYGFLLIMKKVLTSVVVW